jgi:hypothetical protein
MAKNFGRIALSSAFPGAGACLGVDIDNRNIASLFTGQYSKVKAQGRLPRSAFLRE